MKKKQENPIKVLFSFAGEAKGKMTLSVILAVIGELFGMAPFFAVAILASQIYNGTATVGGAAVIATVAALCMVLRTLLTLKSSLRSHGISFTILKNIRCAIADKMRRVPMGVMLETPSGTFKTLLVDNVGRLEDIIAHMIPEFPSNVAAPLASIILVFILDWRMGLASLVTVPLSLLFMLGMMRGYSKKMSTYLRAGNEMNAALVEYVGGIQVIKAFGQTGRSFGRFSDSVNFFHDSTMAWWRQSWFWMAGFKAIFPSTLLGTLPVGALLYMKGEITLPVFMACIIIPIGFLGGFMKLAFGLEQLTYMAANLKPIREFLSTPEQQRPETEINLKERTFEFDNVDFSYDGKSEVLHNVSFTSRPNTITAIVGPSGSGKSTIAKLMAGFWDTTSGTVRFGGSDIRDIPFHQLMNEVSYVAQDNFLFDKTIRENIRMGNPNATDEEVEAAARAANCSDFIMELEDGYDTLAGDAGDRLSGGERQRITLARAMLKPASVVILDEATAYADPESEAQIQEAIIKLIKGKTLIVVAHHLSTIRNADQILVVDKGLLIAKGKHNQLLATCPLYKTMWQQYLGTADVAESEVQQIC
jgi:ATP-binding cassette subfamily B protein